MSHEQFIIRKNWINDRLDSIAKRFNQLALKKEANQSNEEFVKLINLHQHHIEQIENLIDQYEKNEEI